MIDIEGWGVVDWSRLVLDFPPWHGIRNMAARGTANGYTAGRLNCFRASKARGANERFDSVVHVPIVPSDETQKRFLPRSVESSGGASSLSFLNGKAPVLRHGQPHVVAMLRRRDGVRRLLLHQCVAARRGSDSSSMRLTCVVATAGA